VILYKMREKGHMEKQRVLQQGALLIGEPKSEKEQDIQNAEFFTIKFQFNPESLKRTLKIVTPQETLGGRKRGENRQADPRDLKTDSRIGESISITARFDDKEGKGKGTLMMDEARNKPPEKNEENEKQLYSNSHLLGVLSAIETIMEPVDTDLKKTAKAHKNPPKVLPLVFFWWGEYRILPVKITQMTINETEFSPELSPIRAEVNLEMEVLVPGSKSDKRIKSSYKYVQDEKSHQAAAYFRGVDKSPRKRFKEAVLGVKPAKP
jgi:Contractile injection system tube protein